MRINDAKALALVGAAVTVALGTSPARAADNLAPAISTVDGHERPGSGRWQASLGLRTSFLRDPGYDPFSSNDVLTQLSVTVMHAFRSAPGLTPAVGLVWDTGEASASARGVDASLGLMRLAVALEARFTPRPWMYVMARVAPGILHASASLADESAPAPLDTNYTTLSVDGSAGAGVRITPASSPVGFWLVGDGGYGWAPTHDLTLRPSLPKTDAQKAGPTDLGALAVRGAFFRLGLALSY
jgi:hypothetical protein